MESLSRGFCAQALSRCATAADLTCLHTNHATVCLQVVDIQRFPADGAPRKGVSCFYVALSDTVTVMWGVVPPHTPLEEQIAQFDLDVGCCLTLCQFHLVTAACGLNVVVILSADFSPNPQSLLGKPTYDETLFQLSPASLVKSDTPCASLEESRACAAVRPSAATEVVLQSIVERPECVLVPWKIALRVAWKGVAGHLSAPSSRYSGGPSYSPTPRAQRSLVRLIGVDRHGACIGCVVWTPGASDSPNFGAGDCLLLTGGSVKWNDMGLPTELHFNSHDVEAVLTGSSVPPEFPIHPRLLVGQLATTLKSVSSVLTESLVDDIVSVTGVVRSLQPSHHVNTKHGRVLCAELTLEDAADPSLTIDVTLWGGAAEAVRPVQDELWLLHYCTVREFRQRKTLSSRAASLFCRLSCADEYSEATVQADASSYAALFALTTLTPAVASRGNENTVSVSVDESAVSTAAHADQPVAFCLSLSLSDASPTLPVLVRLQSALCVTETPHAGDKADSGTISSVQLILSDGLCCVAATGGPAVMASLFTAADVEALRRLPAAEATELCSRLSAQLVGTPLLTWLLPHTLLSFQGAVPPDCTVVQCHHANASQCSLALLSALDTAHVADC